MEGQFFGVMPSFTWERGGRWRLVDPGDTLDREAAIGVKDYDPMAEEPEAYLDFMDAGSQLWAESRFNVLPPLTGPLALDLTPRYGALWWDQELSRYPTLREWRAEVCALALVGDAIEQVEAPNGTDEATRAKVLQRIVSIRHETGVILLTRYENSYPVDYLKLFKSDIAHIRKRRHEIARDVAMYAEVVNWWLGREISERLEHWGVSVGVRRVSNHWEYVHGTRANLAGALWLQLASVLFDGRHLRRCQYARCGRLFEAGVTRARYCRTPKPGYRSTCKELADAAKRYERVKGEADG